VAGSKDIPRELPQPGPAPDVTMIARAFGEQVARGDLRASLIVLAGWEIGKEVEVHGQAQVMGRSATTDTFINAPSVSRQHAQIDLIEEGGELFFTVTDLGSSNGTHVNNVPVHSTRLHNGDRIRMGDVLFKFALQDEIESEFHKEVHRRIHYDQLTGLLTMEAFRMRLDAAIRESKKPFTLAMTDLDGLKRVNDTHGHLAGRMVVREMGAMMRASLRQQDVAGLYGGDEAIVLYPRTTVDKAREVAEGIRLTIAQRVFEHRGNTFSVSISQGLAEHPLHGESAEEIIAAADKALYAAKAQGRNCVRVFGE